MQKIILSLFVFLAAIIFFAVSCINSGSNAKEHKAGQILHATDSSTASTVSDNQSADTVKNFGDTSAILQQNDNGDSMLSQMKGLASIMGKNDSNILKNIGGRTNMDSIMQKINSQQSLLFYVIENVAEKKFNPFPRTLP